MIRILIAEGDRPTSELIRQSLNNAGYSCLCACDGAEAANMLEKELFDLVLLDVSLEVVTGYELLEYIRPTGTPAIVLTDKGAADDGAKGLRMGAEDYIARPVEEAELLARVEAALRRCQKTEELISVGELCIDLRSLQTSRRGETVFLTKKEWDLMLLFVRNPGTALYRETIYERVWGGEYPDGSRVVDLHIQRLRKKLGWESTLRTVNRVGYRLEL